MEVDLTDDDCIMTTPIQLGASKTPASTPKTPKPPNKPSAPLEILEISDDDDDDIIFEPEKANPPSSGVSTSASKQSSDTLKKLQVSSKNDKTEDIQVFTPIPINERLPLLSSLAENVPKKHSAKDKSGTDDIIEVFDLPPSVSNTEKSKPSTSASVRTPSNSVAKNQSTLLPKDKATDPKVPSGQSKGFKGRSDPTVDDVIEVAESPPRNQEEFSSLNKEKSGANNVAEKNVSIGQAKQSRNVSTCRYVVDITDEEKSKQVTCYPKRNSENTCLNVGCKSGDDLKSAPMFVISYYGCKLKKGKYDVCAECFQAAVDHHAELANRLCHQESLFAYENFRINDIPIVDLESDEETSDNEEPLPFSVLLDLERNLEMALNESFSKYHLDYQIKEATGMLTDKMTSLELEGKKIDDQYDQLQKDIDEMRKKVYEKHNAIIRQVPSLDTATLTLPSTTPQQFDTSTKYPQNIQEYQPFMPHRGVAMKRVTNHSLHSPHRPISPTSLDGCSQEIVALREVNIPQAPLPPIGPLVRPKPRTDDIVYVMKMSFFGVWLRGRVIDVTNTSAANYITNTVYKVKMELQANKKQFSIKTVQGKHMAYPNPASVRLEVGTRVIAVFQDDESNNQNKGGSYYSGLIAEPPKPNNRYRYLVFFDDGYAQYVPHNKILVVCESSSNVWDDIHPDSREFIRKYLNQYPERPMVKLAPNQVVKTEWNGKWWIARVVEVDGSLVKMSFDADKRTEWIYRGSTRLHPLFNELSKQAEAQAVGSGTITRMRGMGVRRVNQPYVEYTQNTGIEDEGSEPAAPTAVSAPSTVVRAVARKSTSSKKHEIHAVIPQTPTSKTLFFSPDNIGIVKELQLPKDALMPKRLQPHTCGPHCIGWIKYDPVKMRGYNPLSIPLYCGWQRELPRFKKKSTILYTAPCGRRLRNMQELHRYLRICKSEMSVDLFDFDYWVNALSEFTLTDKLKKHIVQEDITCGRENVKIPLINYVDNSLPANLIYKNQREPYEGVPLNNDPAFLCGCDCTDDCQNKEKCACWKLTIQGSALYPGGVEDPNVGYYYKRLQERVITGIYECNEQCKCSKKTCLNRVVQHPLQLQLQLFKTPNKGWGLRCVNDIPKGTFICIYAGYLYTEETANTIGELEGDDYLAELDYIEVVERMKEDYESDVEDEEEEEEEDFVDKNAERSRYKGESDSDYKSGRKASLDSNSDASIRSRLRKRTAADLDSGDDSRNSDKGSKRRETSQKNDAEDDDGSDDDKMERLPSSFTPKPLTKTPITDTPVRRFQSVRKFYGPNERVYIMDANQVGNIGRYLNHSCSPNVFVQNVFVDTHDLRFPWVAFFALQYIKAGAELTWDYNYDVGSVPDKQIICQCGSLECRGRLL
ncbi:histone-lysine N-methyltransferase eggless isoform X2 [Thrips palmi]|uniref:Histone-lysine N-methyltransferase eggless isoform X2 n=1 Tax=Thrips palmi TaxID=161013 RepID=A0A6P8ZWT3_THRPL|nr:histone-lysine N-methyltransferase eggless isoform X2 [Thrips palmi]